MPFRDYIGRESVSDIDIRLYRHTGNRLGLSIEPCLISYSKDDVSTYVDEIHEDDIKTVKLEFTFEDTQYFTIISDKENNRINVVQEVKGCFGTGMSNKGSWDREHLIDVICRVPAAIGFILDGQIEALDDKLLLLRVKRNRLG